MISEICTCRHCGKAIVFIDTPGGKKMPCDAKIQKIYVCGAGESGGIFVTAKGTVVRGRTDVEGRTETAYVPHWASCSAQKRPADKTRRRPSATQGPARTASHQEERGGRSGRHMRENPYQETLFQVYYE